MLYLAIPAHNEAATIGVLLWRLRTVLAEFPREYEAVVYDDASDDSTSEILESYARVMPLTVLRGERRIGYAGAVDALIRHVARDTRYPRRDAMLLLQGDFTDSPALVPEFVKRFEGGTDVVVGERGAAVRRKAPTPVRRLMRAEPWLLRFLVRADGIRDLTSSYRLVRISVLRDLLRSVGDGPACAGDSRTANADLLMRLVPLARRVETLPVEPTWEVRLRETRVVAVADGMNLLKWAWKSRGQRAVPSSAPEPAAEHTPRHTRSGRSERQDRDARPELRLESRSDWSTENASTPADNTRHAGSRDAARNGRKARPARGDGRSEGRAERVEGSREARQDGRKPEPRARPQEREPVAPVAELDASTRERPAKRKRSRRGGRDREAAPAVGEESLRPVAGVEADVGLPASQSQPRITERDESDDDMSPRAEAVLSAGLSDAVADAEAELDGEGRQRPRRKRRRRGSRSGRRGGGAEGSQGEGDLADGGSAEAGETESGSDDSGAPQGDAGSDERAARRHARPSSRTASHSEDVADGAATESLDEEGSSDGEGDSSAEGSEARTRRRGRRGRRGGSRRSRAQRGEAGGSEGGSDAESYSEPAREPRTAPEPE